MDALPFSLGGRSRTTLDIAKARYSVTPKPDAPQAAMASAAVFAEAAPTGWRCDRKRRYNRRSLHEVSPLYAVIDIHVRVDVSGLILHRVLNELEARYANRIKGQMAVPKVSRMGQTVGAVVLERASHAANNGLTMSFPCRYTPRIFPVPLSTL